MNTAKILIDCYITGTIGPEPVPGHTLPDRAAFYKLDTNSSKAIVKEKPISISNGLVWNRDNTLLYYIDTATLQIDVFDFDLERGDICKYYCNICIY